MAKLPVSKATVPAPVIVPPSVLVAPLLGAQKAMVPTAALIVPVL